MISITGGRGGGGSGGGVTGGGVVGGRGCDSCPSHFNGKRRFIDLRNDFLCISFVFNSSKSYCLNSVKKQNNFCLT